MILWRVPEGVPHGIVPMTHVVRLASSFKVIFVRTEKVGAGATQSFGMRRESYFRTVTHLLSHIGFVGSALYRLPVTNMEPMEVGRCTSQRSCLDFNSLEHTLTSLSESMDNRRPARIHR